ncbi:uncharacterized protein TrAFT101_005337 [Trichoderma asperellum]|uniref:uncharacterized protein n=1 Tax=Trichoderma asperellum TaxID=101201 RepID=UPI003320BC97|nr:hypothetical protein TrAFT101_005337 [Trichoderma asperellum]
MFAAISALLRITRCPPFKTCFADSPREGKQNEKELPQAEELRAIDQGRLCKIRQYIYTRKRRDFNQTPPAMTAMLQIGLLLF